MWYNGAMEEKTIVRGILKAVGILFLIWLSLALFGVLMTALRT